MAERAIRVAAVGDLHCTTHAQGTLAPLFAQAAEAADVLLLAGDLTDTGLPEEARALVRELTPRRMPTVAVFGNHDLESSREEEIHAILSEAGVDVLDGKAIEVAGIGIAGVKGFGGGFGPRALGAWGEPVIKQFVHAAVNEALKLEAALARLRTAIRIVLLHYAPVQQTVDGEPLEIYPFIGSSRLEEPIDRFDVALVFHGHAHRGRPAGATRTGIPVFNVSMPLLSREYPEQPHFRVFELTAGADGHVTYEAVAAPFSRRLLDPVKA